MAKSNTALSNDEEWEEYTIGDSEGDDDAKADLLNNREDEEEDTDDDDESEHLEHGDEGSGDEDTTESEDDAEGEDGAEGERSSDTGAEHDAQNRAKANTLNPRDGSRSAQRIAELAAALKRQEQTLARTVEELRERDAATRAETELSVRATRLTASRENLKEEIKSLSNQYQVAREDGNAKAEFQIIEDLQRKRLELLATETDLQDVTDKVEALKTTSNKTQKTAPAANPKAVQWLERNSWVSDAPGYIQQAIAAQAEILLTKGVNPDNDKFYDTLDAKVSRMLKDNELDYTVNFRVDPGKARKESVVEKDTPKGKPKSNQPSRERNTGSSDEGLVLGKTKEGKVRVKVTQDDKEMAKMLGIKPGTPRFEKYMKERVRTEGLLKKQSKDTGTLWAPVFEG